jgi:acyl-CoA thioesterase-1
MRRGFNAIHAIFIVTVCFLAVPGGALGQDPVRLMVLGDSLTAGFGLAAEDGFTAQLEAALAEEGYEVEVLNHGVSGDTTAGGVARLDWALADDPHAAIVELGANDMLRGIDPDVAQENLATILERLKDEDIPILLAGMLAAPNWGPEYEAEFNAIYPALAERYEVPLYEFFLDGVAGDPELNQPDGLHPTAEGVSVIVDNILPDVIELVERASASGAS